MFAKYALFTFGYSVNVICVFNGNSGDFPWIYKRFYTDSKTQRILVKLARIEDVRERCMFRISD